MVKSRCPGLSGAFGEISFFSLGWGDVSDGLQQPPMVEPVYPFEGCQFNGLKRAPSPAPMNDLGLLKPVDRLGQRIVVAVANAANRGFDPCLGQTLGVFDRHILGEFNLSSQHPGKECWDGRSASVGWCVAEQAVGSVRVGGGNSEPVSL